MQVLLVFVAAGLLVFSGYSLGRVDGFRDGRRAGAIDAPRRPSIAQALVLGALGVGAFAAALAVQGWGGVHVPTPARLEELTGRAETAARERAEKAAGSGAETTAARERAKKAAGSGAETTAARERAEKAAGSP